MSRNPCAWRSVFGPRAWMFRTLFSNCTSVFSKPAACGIREASVSSLPCLPCAAACTRSASEPAHPSARANSAVRMVAEAGAEIAHRTCSAARQANASLPVSPNVVPKSAVPTVAAAIAACAPWRQRAKTACASSPAIPIAKTRNAVPTVVAGVAGCVPAAWPASTIGANLQ